MKDAIKIINGAYAIGTIQVYDEFLDAINFVIDKNINSFIEIGTDAGGTFYAWTCCSTPGLRVSIDIPHGNYGRGTDVFSETNRNAILSGYPGECYFIAGSSHDTEVINTLTGKLGGRLVDFLFIDGDHTEEGVVQDFLNYKKFVKDGGWIGFHDIKQSEFHIANNCRVDLLWSNLRGNKIEFINRSYSSGGFGFIQNNSDLVYMR